MTTKLTLSVDAKVITSAKKYARKKGKSLSALVENYLKSLDTGEKSDVKISSRVKSLMGVIELPENFDYKKALGKAISRKSVK